MPITQTFSVVNAVYSLFLVMLMGAVIWYKMHLLRMEIHILIEKLPNLGSEFIRRDMDEVRREMDTVKARLGLCEKRQGINGEGL